MRDRVDNATSYTFCKNIIIETTNELCVLRIEQDIREKACPLGMDSWCTRTVGPKAHQTNCCTTLAIAHVSQLFLTAILCI